MRLVDAAARYDLEARSSGRRHGKGDEKSGGHLAPQTMEINGVAMRRFEHARFEGGP